LHILLGEMVPKNIALADPPRTAMLLAPIHRAYVRLLRPVVATLYFLAVGILRLLGVEALDERAQAKTPEELFLLLEEAHLGEVLDGYDFTLLSNTLELGAGTIIDAVVPWSEVDTAPASATVSSIEQSMAQSAHSRLALVGERGEPMGWVHAKDLLAVDSQFWDEPLPAHRKRRLLAIDHEMAVEDALEHMQANRQHFALATRKGETIGIITLEDVLEVLVSGLAGSAERP
jgi:CBS domain containing-hemolysin-like protein